MAQGVRLSSAARTPVEHTFKRGHRRGIEQTVAGAGRFAETRGAEAGGDFLCAFFQTMADFLKTSILLIWRPTRAGARTA